MIMVSLRRTAAKGLASAGSVGYQCPAAMTEFADPTTVAAIARAHRAHAKATGRWVSYDDILHTFGKEKAEAALNAVEQKFRRFE